jgi:hypothetical protein
MSKAKVIVQKLIRLIQDELAEWEDSMNQSDYEYGDDDDDYGDSSFDYAMDNDFKSDAPSQEMSQSDIQDLIDQALDRRDFTEVERLSKLLKENN